MTRVRPVFVALSVALSAALVGWLLTRVPLARVADVLVRARPGWLAGAAVLYLATYVARAARLRVLAHRAGLARLYGVVAVHTALLRVVPFRLAELTFPLIQSRLAGEDFARSTIVMVHVRLLDLAVLLPGFAVAVLALGGAVGAGGRAFAALAAAGVVVVVAALVKLPALARLAARVAGRFRRGVRPAERLRAAAAEWDGLAPATVVAAVLWGAAAWALLYVCVWMIARGCGVEVGYGTVIVAASASLMAALVPVSVGTIGFLESGLAFGLAALGVAAERAIATGLIFQWGTLALALAAGAVSYAALAGRAAPRGRTPRSEAPP